MLRHVLLLVCIACSINLWAQESNSTSVKTTQNKHEIDYKQVGAPLPQFIFMPYSGKDGKEDSAGTSKPYMTNKDFDNGANIFVMMFNPTCSHCQGQTIMFEKSADLFKQSKLLLVANPMMKPYLSDFIGLTHADQYPFMYLGIDSAGFVDNLFLYQSLPQLNIYDGERKLIRTYTGEVSMDSLKKYIQ